MNKLKTLWTNSLEEAENFLNYKFSDEHKHLLKGMLIKNCSEQINEYLDEHLITLTYAPLTNQCYKYNESITIRLKGKVEKNLVWEYSGINYCTRGLC